MSTKRTGISQNRRRVSDPSYTCWLCLATRATRETKVQSHPYLTPIRSLVNCCRTVLIHSVS